MSAPTEQVRRAAFPRPAGTSISMRRIATLAAALLLLVAVTFAMSRQRAVETIAPPSGYTTNGAVTTSGTAVTGTGPGLEAVAGGFDDAGPAVTGTGPGLVQVADGSDG